MSDRPADLPRSTNKLLAGLSRADHELLQSRLRPEALPFRMVVEFPQQIIDRIYFPESGLISVMASTLQDRKVEVGIIGFEGMSGLAVVLGADRSPNTSLVQLGGTSLSIETEALKDAMAASGPLRERLMLFAQAFFVQASQTALANGKANIEERLARWLLISHDRIVGDELPLTHEFLSIMLGVRRAGVTVALHNLEAEGYVRAARGKVTIVDRDGLRAFADGLYGVAEAEYERLLGTPISN